MSLLVRYLVLFNYQYKEEKDCKTEVHILPLMQHSSNLSSVKNIY